MDYGALMRMSEESSLPSNILQWVAVQGLLVTICMIGAGNTASKKSNEGQIEMWAGVCAM